MHDGQLEDLLRATLRTEGDALPTTITTAELERRMASRRRDRRSSRLGLVAAGVAVALVGSAVVVSSGWLGAPSVGSGHTATHSANTNPAAVGADCETIDPAFADQAPTVSLGLTPGDSILHPGRRQQFRLGDRTAHVLFSGPEPEPIQVEAGMRLDVVAQDPGACLAQVTATYTRGKLIHTFGAQSAESGSVLGNKAEIPLPPGAGEWQLTIDASFVAVDPTYVASSKTLFRVSMPELEPNDASVLGPFPHLASPPQTILLDTLQSTPDGPAGAVNTSVAGQVPPRGLYIFDVACLSPTPMRWSIGHEGQLDLLAAEDQPCDGTVTTGSIDHGTPNAPLDVVVNADASTIWRIRIATNEGTPAFVPPVLRAIETGNTGGSDVAVEAFGRCAAIGDGSVPCGGEWFDLDGARALRIPTGARVTFGLEDAWLIEAARITAVRVGDLGENAFAPEHSVALVDQPGPLATVDVALGRGSWIVRVALNGSRDGDTFNAHYDMRVETE